MNHGGSYSVLLLGVYAGKVIPAAIVLFRLRAVSRGAGPFTEAVQGSVRFNGSAGWLSRHSGETTRGPVCGLVTTACEPCFARRLGV